MENREKDENGEELKSSMKAYANTTIDAEVKQMALSKGINMSQTLEDALSVELQISEKNPVKTEEKLKIAKQKMRKMTQIIREKCQKITELEGKIAQFQVKNDQKQTKFDMRTHSKSPLEIRNTPEIWDKLPLDEKKRINNQITTNQTITKIDRSEVEDKKQKYLKKNADRIEEAKRYSEERIKRDEKEARERAEKEKTLS